MREALTERIVKQLESLPYAEQQRILEFAKALGQTKPAGVTWEELMPFAGSIAKEDLRRMAEAIEEGCERIDSDEW